MTRFNRRNIQHYYNELVSIFDSTSISNIKQFRFSKSVSFSNIIFERFELFCRRIAIEINLQKQKKLKYLRIKIRELKQSFQSIRQFRFFFKNNRFDKIFQQFRRIKIISNSFQNRFRSKKSNLFNQNARY